MKTGTLVDLGRIEFWVEMWEYLRSEWRFNPSGLVLPASRPEFGWLIVNPGLTAMEVYRLCQNHFWCFRRTKDLNAAISRHKGRDAEKDLYVIRVRDRIEADRQYRNVSAIAAQRRNLNGITLTERQLLELAVFLVSGKKDHLDCESQTICSGSSNTNLRIPLVGLEDDEVCVTWIGANEANSNWGIREVISNF